MWERVISCMITKKQTIFKIVLILGGALLLQLLFGLFTLYQVYMSQATAYINQTTKRIEDDITFSDGTWNLSRYNADAVVPDTYPIYILSSDGYVIDRWKPIHGFLDTSDTKHLNAYLTPQTVKTPTEQTWRVYSKQIQQNGQNLGVITIGVYLPSGIPSDDTDTKLAQVANKLAQKISVRNGSLDVSQIDTRDVSFDITFQIVDRYNKIIAKNNNTNSIDRLPNYIDLSYVGNLLTSPNIQQVRDTQTNEPFLFLTSPLIHNNTVMGVLVVGRSIASLQDLLGKFLLIDIISGIILSMLGSLLLWKTLLPKMQQADEEKLPEVNHILFNKTDSILLLDTTEIVIPYATNQYYLCEALFSHPKKRFETDELLERFGEHDFSNTRKVYDAMLMVNKKVTPILGTRLIIAKEKTYQINPSLLSKIQ